MFGETAGRQCSCCALFSICFSLVKRPTYWKPCDLDFIVREGDKLYKAENTSLYLMATELPRLVTLFGSEVRFYRKQIWFCKLRISQFISIAVFGRFREIKYQRKVWKEVIR